MIFKKRSVDLYLEDSQLINWFYGIKKHLKETDKKYKIISVNNFVLTKLKLRIMQKLKEDFSSSNKHKIDEKYKELVSGILNGKEIYFLYFLDKGIQSFSFVKILIMRKLILVFLI
jgi:hypothetical protein